MQKYKKVSAPVKASIWFTVCNAIQKGISLLSTPIFTRLLTPEQYGTYTVYQSWYQIISIFATLNLFYGVFNNGMTKFPNDKRTFTSSMQGLSTTLTVCFFVYILYAHPFGTSCWNCPRCMYSRCLPNCFLRRNSIFGPPMRDMTTNIENWWLLPS